MRGDASMGKRDGGSFKSGVVEDSCWMPAPSAARSSWGCTVPSDNMMYCIARIFTQIQCTPGHKLYDARLLSRDEP